MHNRIESLVDELNCPPKTINSLFVILRPCHVDNSRFIQCNVDNNYSEYPNILMDIYSTFSTKSWFADCCQVAR